MIIIEGADNVGKSTLVARLLREDPRLHLLKRERFKVDRGESIGWSYFNMLVPTDSNYTKHAFGIADRMLASECIYGDLFRGGCRMTPREHLLIKTVLMCYGTVVVHCDAPDETIRKSWSNREQLYDDPIRIAHEYRARVKSIFNPIEVIRFDWTMDNADDVVHYILARNAVLVMQTEMQLDLPALIQEVYHARR